MGSPAVGWRGTEDRERSPGNPAQSHTRKTPESQQSRDAALAFHIREFVPDASGEELEHRTALLKARDYAAAVRGQATSRLAYDHACSAHEIAGDFVFADVSADRLKIAVSYCRNLVHAAYLAEHLDSDGGGR